MSVSVPCLHFQNDNFNFYILQDLAQIQVQIKIIFCSWESNIGQKVRSKVDGPGGLNWMVQTTESGRSWVMVKLGLW